MKLLFRLAWVLATVAQCIQAQTVTLYIEEVGNDIQFTVSGSITSVDGLEFSNSLGAEFSITSVSSEDPGFVSINSGSSSFRFQGEATQMYIRKGGTSTGFETVFASGTSSAVFRTGQVVNSAPTTVFVSGQFVYLLV